MATLQYGSKGNEVIELQKFLNSAGYNVGATDGIFGSKTQAGVKAYQQAMGLSVDGIVGNQTWGSINTYNAPAPAPTSTGTNTPPKTGGGSAPPPNTNTNTGTATGTNTGATTPPPFVMEPPKYINYTPYTDEQFSDMAKNRISPIYDARELAATQQTDRLTQLLNQQMEGLNPLYQNREKELNTFYGQEKQRASDQALKRGLGRSSIATNAQTRLGAEQGQSIQKLQEQKAMEIGHINNQITTLQSQLAESIAQMNINEAIEIAGLIDQLRMEQQNKMADIDMANAQLHQGYQSDLSRMYQWEQEMITNQANFDKNFNFNQEKFDWDKSMDTKNYELDAQKVYQSQQQSIAKAAEDKKKAAPATKYTPEQYKYFESLRNIYMGNGGGTQKYKNDPEAAIIHLQQNKAANVKLIGEELYNTLLKELQGYQKDFSSFGVTDRDVINTFESLPVDQRQEYFKQYGGYIYQRAPKAYKYIEDQLGLSDADYIKALIEGNRNQ